MENKRRQGIRWLIFIVVGILIQSLHIEYVIGIKLSFTGIIIVFLIRQYSTHMVLISLALIYAISIKISFGFTSSCSIIVKSAIINGFCLKYFSDILMDTGRAFLPSNFHILICLQTF